MRQKTRYLTIIILCSLYFKAFAQEQSFLSYQKEVNDSTVKNQLAQTVIISAAIYSASLIVLNEMWYKQHPRQSFHFFNDHMQWKYVDKLGHFYTSYQINRLGHNALKKCGLNTKKAAIWGSLLGTIALTPIEVLDGFSSGYGASWGDALANAAGSGLYASQYLLWKEERIFPKFSFHRSSLAHERPSLLGSNFYEEIIKDYNGQTYWLSIDIDKFSSDSFGFPKWLNFSVGYGAYNMIFAEDIQNKAAGFNPYRQYFLGIDLDFSYLKSNNKYLNTFLFLIKSIRLPAPALEYNRKKGLILHSVYF